MMLMPSASSIAGPIGKLTDAAFRALFSASRRLVFSDLVSHCRWFGLTQFLCRQMIGVLCAASINSPSSL